MMLCAGMLCGQRASAQESAARWTVCGHVVDVQRGAPVEGARLQTASARAAVRSASGGQFCLSLDSARVVSALLSGRFDSLRVEADGYATATLALPPLDAPPTVIRLQKLRGDNAWTPADSAARRTAGEWLWARVVAAKPLNDPDRLRNYRARLYTKMELDLTHLSAERVRRFPLPRGAGFLFSGLDTALPEGAVLPAYLTETVSDYFYGSRPRRSRERILGVRTLGVRSGAVAKLAGGLNTTLNPYDEKIAVLDRRFPSPLADDAMEHYRFATGDTAVDDAGHTSVELRFWPRDAERPAFEGSLWIADSLLAVQRAALHLPQPSPVSYLLRAEIYQTYARILPGGRYFPVRDSFLAEATAPHRAGLPAVMGRKVGVWSAVLANDPATDDTLRARWWPVDGILLQDGAQSRPDAFWEDARPARLSAGEQGIYRTLDAVVNAPAYRRGKAALWTLATGFVDAGPVEVGNIYSVYNTNPVEGARLRLEVRTTPELSRRVQLRSAFGVGTLDGQFKHNTRLLWIPRRAPRTTVTLGLLHDLDWTSNGYYDDGAATLNTNVFTTLLRREEPPWKAVFLHEYRAEVFRDLGWGLGATLVLAHRTLDPYEPLPSADLFKDETGRTIPQVTSAEAGVVLRWAWRERFLEGPYQRISLGSAFPVVEARFAVGPKGVLGAGYSYRRLRLAVTQRVSIGVLGSLHYHAFAGRYWSADALPYPLLELHPGNDFGVYNPRAFNMLRRYEAVSDRYAGGFFEHSLGRRALGWIPGVRALRLVPFWNVRAVTGELSPANKALNFSTGYRFRAVDGKPYAELGTGVDNILRVGRIDCVWRVSPAPLVGEDRFGVFASVRFGL